MANFTCPAAIVHVLLLPSWKKISAWPSYCYSTFCKSFTVLKAEYCLKIQNHISFQDSKLSVASYNGPPLQTFLCNISQLV